MPRELTAAALREAKARRTQLRRRMMWGVPSAGLFAFIVYLLFVPFEGDMRFGACRTLLELNTPIPSTLALTGLEDRGSEMVIWFTHTNPHGQYRLELMTCTFAPEPSAPGGFIIAAAEVGRRALTDAELDAFNRALPSVYAGRPDLVLPAPLPDALEDLQVDPTQYYRRLF